MVRSTATLSNVLIYPVKSLDPEPVDRSRIVERGALANDREFAMVDADGSYVNGKAERAVHRIRSAFDRETRRLRLGAPGMESTSAHVDDERDRLARWLTDYFGYEVRLRRNSTGGFPDDRDASGPTVISASTVDTVAGWFSSIDAPEMRRRLRPNLVVSGRDLPAFWEDALFADRDHVVAFDVGEATMKGVNPCQRCVVPTRDPDTGRTDEGFRERFVGRRRETLPEWSGGEWFDHHFRLMVNTRVPESSWGAEIAVGDPVEIGATRPV